MHVVVFDLVHLDRAKCAESHMKRHMGDHNAHCLDLRQKLLCKVKSRRRGRSRSLMLRINSLVTGLIL